MLVIKTLKTFKDNAVPYLFILPQYIFFLVFFAVPVVTALIISFFKWDFINKPVFVGLHNYQQILGNKDGYFFHDFMNGLFNTTKYVIFSVPFLVSIPMLIAAGLKSITKGSRLFQSIFYLPSLLSVATVMLTWKWMLDKNFGIVNHVLHSDIGWTADQPYFWISVVVLSVWWGIGGNMIIFIAGMADISGELYEAADIDGANAIRKFFSITLPGLKNQIFYTTIMTTIASFNIYGQPLMLAGSNPTDDKKVLMISIQQMAFGGTSQQAGMASAMAIVLGLIIMFVSMFQFRLSNTED